MTVTTAQLDDLESKALGVDTARDAYNSAPDETPAEHAAYRAMERADAEFASPGRR